MQLCNDRQLSLGYGVGIYGPIPFTAVDAYARRFGIDDPDDFDGFSGLIREMDAEWLAFVNKKKP